MLHELFSVLRAGGARSARLGRNSLFVLYGGHSSKSGSGKYMYLCVTYKLTLPYRIALITAQMTAVMRALDK